MTAFELDACIGALAIVANEGQGAVDERLRLTSVAFAYGEIDWVRRLVLASSW